MKWLVIVSVVILPNLGLAQTSGGKAYCIMDPILKCGTLVPGRLIHPDKSWCYPDCYLSDNERTALVDERLHKTLTRDAVMKDWLLIKDLLESLSKLYGCPDVRLTPMDANPAQDREWHRYNQIWHRVYHVTICRKPYVFRWLRVDPDGQNVFRDETDLYRDGFIPR